MDPNNADLTQSWILSHYAESDSRSILNSQSSLLIKYLLSLIPESGSCQDLGPGSRLNPYYKQSLDPE